MRERGRFGGSADTDRDDLRDEREREFEHGRDRGFFGDERGRRFLGRDESDRTGRREASGFFGPSRSSAADRHGRSGPDWDRDREYFGYDDYHEGLPINETSRLIGSNKVEGTPVYGRDGDRLGTIYNFMVDKVSGRVEYAVMRYGGFLGIGQRYYPLPWRILSYDTKEGGYRIAMRHRDLESAPSFDRDTEPRFNREYGRRVHDYYGLDY